MVEAATYAEAGHLRSCAMIETGEGLLNQFRTNEITGVMSMIMEQKSHIWNLYSALPRASVVDDMYIPYWWRRND